METASFGSRGCILQGKVALCPATPCIDSMGTATHMDDGALKNSFFFFFQLSSGRIMTWRDFSKKRWGEGKFGGARKERVKFPAILSGRSTRENEFRRFPPPPFGREMKRIDVPFKNLLSRAAEPGAPSKLRITTSLGVMDISPRKKGGIGQDLSPVEYRRASLIGWK